MALCHCHLFLELISQGLCNKPFNVSVSRQQLQQKKLRTTEGLCFPVFLALFLPLFRWFSSRSLILLWCELCIQRDEQPPCTSPFISPPLSTNAFQRLFGFFFPSPLPVDSPNLARVLVIFCCSPETWALTMNQIRITLELTVRSPSTVVVQSHSAVQRLYTTHITRFLCDSVLWNTFQPLGN